MFCTNIPSTSCNYISTRNDCTLATKLPNIKNPTLSTLIQMTFLNNNKNYFIKDKHFISIIIIIQLQNNDRKCYQDFLLGRGYEKNREICYTVLKQNKKMLIHQ